MTQEEKAKAYDEVVEKLSKLYRDYDSVSNLIDVKEELENILSELKESEGERIRKAIIEIVKKDEERIGVNAHLKKIQWLDEQGEHAKFRDSIQVGDKVTRNRDGVLVNLSQLKRVAKPAENKRTNLVEEEMTPFQKKVFCIVDTAIEEEQGLSNICKELLALAKQEIKQTLEVKEVDLIIHTIIAECCDWLAMNTNLSHNEIEDCRNLMLTVKEEQFKIQKGEEV